MGSQAGVVDINHAFLLYYKNVVCGLSFSRSQPDFEGFLQVLRFPPSSKLTPSLFQFDRMQDLPENHFRVSGASWVNIIHYYSFMHACMHSFIHNFQFAQYCKELKSNNPDLWASFLNNNNYCTFKVPITPKNIFRLIKSSY